MVMELMAGKLIQACWNMKWKLLLHHFTICEYFLSSIAKICLFMSIQLISMMGSRRFKGTFRNQDVAIKVLRAEHINENMQKEFAQEVYIMRFFISCPLPSTGSAFIILFVCFTPLSLNLYMSIGYVYLSANHYWILFIAAIMKPL